MTTSIQNNVCIVVTMYGNDNTKNEYRVFDTRTVANDYVYLQIKNFMKTEVPLRADDSENIDYPDRWRTLVYQELILWENHPYKDIHILLETFHSLEGLPISFEVWKKPIQTVV